MLKKWCKCGKVIKRKQWACELCLEKKYREKAKKKKPVKRLDI